jgi:serine/threonine protein kinase/CHAT domain-containing protein/tetratricopeptide (TPR) repeat protein
MSVNQITCPPPEVLSRLLDEGLDDADRDSVETHVEICHDCQTLLETMLTSTYRPVGAKPAPVVDNLDSPFFERLKELAPLDSTELNRPLRRLGQYEIHELLGKGGMGDVYCARHVALGKLVALKVLKPDCMDEMAVARFKQEIRAVGRLDHPNIVVAHDAGKTDGRHYLVMEYVDGLDLARLVERHGALSVPDACEAVRQAAVGLQHAYERGLVHRDVKPSNLILGRDGRVRLLDLGLARSFGDAPADTLTAQGALLGTADYLAPEQWEQPSAADIRADIYSLGCTLYHLLVGHPPFSEQRTVYAKACAHAEQSAPLMSDTNPDVPSNLEAVVERMLSKHPADRFDTPAEVAAALAPHASGSNLAQLTADVSGDASPKAPSSPTPANAGSRIRRRATSMARPALIALFGGCVVALSLFFFGPWTRQARTTPDSSVQVAITDFHVNHFQGKDSKPVGDIADAAQPIRINDSVKVVARFDKPTYCYLIALNPDGGEQLCHPVFEGDRPQEALATRPEAITALKFFPDDKGVFALDSSGLQVFVLIASSNPLPPIGEWRSQFGKTPWKRVGFGGEYRWRYNGKEFVRLPIERGKHGERISEPQVLREVCKAFESRAGVEAVRAIAFPVVNADETAELAAKATELCKADRFDDAIRTLEQRFELIRKSKGEKHYETTNAVRGLKAFKSVAGWPKSKRDEFISLYQLYDDILELENQGKYAEAVPLAKQHLDTRVRLHGPKDETVAVSTVKLAQLMHQAGKRADAEALFRDALEILRGVLEPDHPALATATSNLASSLNAQSKFAEAGKLYEQVLASSRKHYGDDSPETAIAYNNLAGHFNDLGRFAASVEYYQKAIDILARAEGENGRRTITARSNLAFNLNRQTRYAEAEPLYRQVLAARRKVLGERHPDTAMSYGNLATNLDEMSRHAEAEPLAKKAMDLLHERYGEDNWMTAYAINNYAMNLQHQGKFAAAEPLFRNAVDIHRRETKDGVSRSTANALNNLGTNLQNLGNNDAARKCLEEAMAMYAKVLPPEHPDLLYCRTNLAALLDSQGDHVGAEKALSQAYKAFEKNYGKKNRLTAQALANWGINLHNQGKYTEAEPLIAEALALHRKILGEGHSATTWNYLKLIANWWALGKHLQIAELGPAAAASFESARSGLSATGLERVARMNDLTPLFNYLSAVSAAADQPVAAWRYLEGRLGRGLLDELAVRSPSDQSSDRKEGVVRSIAELPQIRSHLDPDTAMICWVDIAGDKTFKIPEGFHFAVVVRKTGDPVWIRIGDDGALGAKVRNLLGKRPSASDGSWEDDVKTLYARRLAPLEKHFGAIDGRPAVRRLIVLPSNVMAGIPIEALTEKYAVSYAPSGTTISYLRGRGGRSSSSVRSLLALGDPNFQRAASSDAAVAERMTPFGALPATRIELHAVARLFPSASVLTGSEASEQTLKRMAISNELHRFRFLHFATHGVLDDRNMLNSALILAQDQLPDSLSQILDGKRPIDGRLTAADVLRDWKLDAELVTLSACETALGKFSGGEGYVGFSQALFVAGARCVLLSNWKVDDRATALLMRRFYENLLGDDSQPMSKADALAEAKHWLKNLSVEEVEKLTIDLPKGLPEGTRGARREISSTPKTQTPRPFQHPYYWSSFVLIGDAS